MTQPFSMIETLRDFVSKADMLGIQYMVTGSFAMSAYGEIRTTRDIDIVVELEKGKAKHFARIFSDNYYVSEQSVDRAISNRSMFNVISQEFGGKLDIIVRKNTDFGQTSFERRFKAKVSGFEFWTTTKEDLILAKLDWAKDTKSEMQIRDIANLTSSEYDSGYVSEWIEKMHLETIWCEVEKWKTLRQRTGD